MVRCLADVLGGGGDVGCDGSFCCGGVGGFLIKCFEGGHLLEDQPWRGMSCRTGRQVRNINNSHKIKIILLMPPIQPNATHTTQATCVQRHCWSPIIIIQARGIDWKEYCLIYPDFHFCFHSCFHFYLMDKIDKFRKTIHLQARGSHWSKDCLHLPRLSLRSHWSLRWRSDEGSSRSE